MGMKIEKSWHEKLREEIAKPYIAELKEFLDKEKERISCLSQHCGKTGDGLFRSVCSELHRPECLKWREADEPRKM